MSVTAPSSSGASRLAVSPDGSLIAHLEPDRISVLDGEALTVVAEIGIDPEAEDVDVALCGDPLRLVVLSRYPASARLHMIDPRGPAAVGELPVRPQSRLLAAAGDHVWLQTPSGATTIDVIQREPVLYPLALRAPVAAVGTFASGRFVASTGGVLEEWDPETRAPARRFRLSRPLTALFVGGGARLAWLIPPDGDRIELVPLLGQSQPTRIELPEVMARVAAHPAHEALAAIGAASGKGWVIDLTGRKPPVELEGVRATDVAWLGSRASLVVVSASGVEVVPASGKVRGAVAEVEPAAPVRATPRVLSAPVPAAAPTGSSGTTTTSVPGARMIGGAPAASAPVAGKATAWRERVRSAPRPLEAGWEHDEAEPGWRDQLASWARAVLERTPVDSPEPEDGPAVTVAKRLGLGGDAAEALWLVYGAHLNGVDGVSAMDLAHLIGRRWPEVLGQGQLAASGALVWRRSRVRLAPAVRAALDEAPASGVWLASEAAAPDGAVAVIARADGDLATIARWIAPQVGPLLVSGGALAGRVLAARARGGLAVVRWPAAGAAAAATGGATEAAPVALLVVVDEAAARAAGAPVVATWPG